MSFIDERKSKILQQGRHSPIIILPKCLAPAITQRFAPLLIVVTPNYDNQVQPMRMKGLPENSGSWSANDLNDLLSCQILVQG